MLYQVAKIELKSPPRRVPLLAMVFEAGAILLVSLALVWIV